MNLPTMFGSRSPYHPRVLMAAVALLVLLGGRSTSATAAKPNERPNVIVIITDDQGYGDIAAHGNREIKTPAMDQLHSESVRLTNYHVDPTCSPTRSALMTGRYSTRTGVWHTIQGRSLMSPDEITIAEMLSSAGYRCGMFGKWHLGDNAPCRPQDAGFDHVVIHGGGGVGQTPDHWGNDYFDDTYFVNEREKTYDGYCTDIWFDEALSFIEDNKARPFFAYISTNAPHGPFLVADKHSRPYKQMGIKSPRAEFYGMITNIDENLSRLREKLTEWNLSENTLLIFTTDNGTAAGMRNGGFNAGMRGTKGSAYDGGHRVPCFLHWPKGGYTTGTDLDALAAHIDMLPTLADICEVDREVLTNPLDGVSLRPLLDGQDSVKTAPRTIMVHSQRIEFPQKWKTSSVMTQQYRLINGKELYDIQKDPGQQTNIASDNPVVVGDLREAYEVWWSSLQPVFDQYVRPELGSDAAAETVLTAHDWHEPVGGQVPWNHGMIKKDVHVNGFWTVDVVKAGRYAITLRIRPEGDEIPMMSTHAKVRVGERVVGKLIEPEATATTFELDLEAGPTTLQTTLTGKNDKTRGAYFVTVKRLSDSE